MSDDELVELTGDDIPYHLRDAVPPLGHCTGCLRQIWDANSLMTRCKMPQPDGRICGGLISGPGG